MTLRNIGGLWKAKEGSKCVLSGTIDLLGQPIRIGVFKNENTEGNRPPYDIVRFPDDDKKEPVRENEGF